MATTKLALYNHALRIIKQRKLSTVTDSVESRRLLDDEYTPAIGWALEQGDWNFATISAAVEASDVVEPEFGYSYAVPKPDDWVRTIATSGNGDFWPPLGAGEYVDEGAYWNCNVDPLYVRYVSDDTEAGLDLTLWPATFALAVAHELAFRIAPHLTTPSASELQELERKRDKAFADARNKDARNQAPDRKAVGRLVRARAGGRAFGPRRQW